MQTKNAISGIAAAALWAISAAPAAADRPDIWSGFYFGANAGYGTVRDSSPKISGAVGGVHAGYNHQLGSVVLGVEADYSWSGMEGTSSFSTGSGTGTVKVGVDDFWSVRARLGLLATPNLMIYGTAGYGGLNASATATLGTATATARGSSEGFLGGGGVEYAFTSNILGRVQGIGGEDIVVVRGGLSFKF